MKINKIILIIGIIIIFSTNLFALKMLEPEYTDINDFKEIDLGYFSPDESFLISFLIENNENYDDIKIMDYQKNDFIIEKTNNTKESIFTTIKINKKIEGEYILNVILFSKNMQKNIPLKINITNNVVHTQINKIQNKIKYNQIQEIEITAYNKSNTTKKISITSNLPDTWFNKNQNKLKYMTLQPNSQTKIIYEYSPKEIGLRKFELKINKIFEETKDENKIITYNLEIDVLKNLFGIYGSRDHSLPLFNSNIIPVYYFNKIIKIFKN
ncbi:MAG: hypothetical protein PHR26_01060 [Candidatus ainarchaeum sp.]|nr:hypothetical protein [Candidatus ainarchaeum sp.]MDD3975847.1 hypothetical protein [Candidatus ainarchaeum sp.]